MNRQMSPQLEFELGNENILRIEGNLYKSKIKLIHKKL